MLDILHISYLLICNIICRIILQYLVLLLFILFKDEWLILVLD